jgi:hypothetical protein
MFLPQYISHRIQKYFSCLERAITWAFDGRSSKLDPACSFLCYCNTNVEIDGAKIRNDLQINQSAPLPPERRTTGTIVLQTIHATIGLQTIPTGCFAVKRRLEDLAKLSMC